MSAPAARLLDAVLNILNMDESPWMVNETHLFVFLEQVSCLGHMERALLVALDTPARAITHFLPKLGHGCRGFDPMCRLVSTLVRACNTSTSPPDGEWGEEGGGVGAALPSPEALACDPDDPPELRVAMRLRPESEQALLLRPFLEEAVARCPELAGRITRHLCWECRTDRAGVLYKVLVESTLNATSGQTTAAYRPFFFTLTSVLELQDSLITHRAQHCLPHVLDRCARLAKRNAPGDDEFLYEVSKLLLWLGLRVPAVFGFLMQCRDQPGGWGSWRRLRMSDQVNYYNA